MPFLGEIKEPASRKPSVWKRRWGHSEKLPRESVSSHEARVADTRRDSKIVKYIILSAGLLEGKEDTKIIGA